jgi:hypothetical protein
LGKLEFYLRRLLEQAAEKFNCPPRRVGWAKARLRRTHYPIAVIPGDASASNYGAQLRT